MTTKADIIADVQAAADAYFGADPETGRAVYLVLGTPGTKIEIADQTWLSGATWANVPGVLETVIEGLAAWLDAHGLGGGGLPPQAGHAGEWLTTDGATASWAPVDLDVDGGFANATYLPTQVFDGGGA
jgi:hypothetical protein